MVGIPRVYMVGIHLPVIYPGCTMVGIHLPVICPGIPPWVHPACYCLLVYRSSCSSL